MNTSNIKDVADDDDDDDDYILGLPFQVWFNTHTHLSKWIR